MSVSDKKCCRVCLSPDSAFVRAFGMFQGRPVDEIVQKVCRVKLNPSRNLPQHICEHCISSLLLAESFQELCQKNEKFWVELGSSIVDEEHKTEIENNAIQHDKNVSLVQNELETDGIDWKILERINRKTLEQQKPSLRMFSCSNCDLQFSSRHKLNYHRLLEHVQPKKLTCDRCGFRFKIKSLLINHLNVVHLRIKRFNCGFCNSAIYSKTHLDTHRKMHEKIKEFNCSRCSKSFCRKENLAVHERMHRSERPYRCKRCSRTFTAHTDLKRHIFTHTQVHPYSCKLCSEGFFLKRLLIDHVSKFHPGIDTSSWLNGKTLHCF